MPRTLISNHSLESCATGSQCNISVILTFTTWQQITLIYATTFVILKKAIFSLCCVIFFYYSKNQNLLKFQTPFGRMERPLTSVRVLSTSADYRMPALWPREKLNVTKVQPEDSSAYLLSHKTAQKQEWPQLGGRDQTWRVMWSG